MQLTCPHCRHTVDFTSVRPRFCSFCGQSLANTSQEELETPTVTTAPRFDLPTSLVDDLPGDRGRTYQTGDVIGGYRLERKIGSGAMGSVFEAEHAASGQRVAIKLIAPDYAMSQAAVERFRLEGRLASTITHPRCVFVLAADEDAGQPYIVMELMPGTTLTTLVEQRGPLPPVEAIRKILDVIDGLNEAHRLGVIHRDVKPSNCFVDADGRVKVGDFGLAKSVNEEKDLTHSGAFVGTVMFASPEQIKRQPLDAQSDVYSVCATLFFLLTGKPPFAGGDALAAATRIVSEEAPSTHEFRPDVPEALDRVIRRGLEREKSKRWPDLESLREALVRFLPGQHSIGGLGSRFVAYLIDALLLLLLMTGLRLFWNERYGASDFTEGVKPEIISAIIRTWALDLGIRLVVWTVFFGLLEGIWGWSPGKLLMRLRVNRANSIEVPGVWRAACRALVCFLLLECGYIASVLLLLFVFHSSVGMGMLEFGLVMAVSGMLQYGGYLVGIGLLCSTMRSSNGYRGLHEIVSGTRVLELPLRRRRRAPLAATYQMPLMHPEGMPSQLGRFPIEGAVVWRPERSTLLGQDPSLGRSVWISYRNRMPTDLERRRREITRLTRLRWVASGRDTRSSWDAYLAPTGVPLPVLVAQHGRFSWDEAAPILDQLADELDAAIDDETLPEVLTPAQVWVGPEGRVQLISAPLQADPEDAAAGDDEQRSLRLLRKVAVLLLEGRERGDDPPRVRAPIPRFASECVNALFPGPGEIESPRVFRKRLHDLLKLPADVSRPRRFGHVCLIGVMMFVMLSCLFGALSSTSMFSEMFQFVRDIKLKRELEVAARRDLAASQLNPDPKLRLVGLARYAEDQLLLEQITQRMDSGRQRWRIRIEESSYFLRQYLQIQQNSMEAQLNQPLGSYARPSIRQHAREVLSEPDNTNLVFDLVQWFYLLVGPVLWICWAFISRGGLTMRLLGMELVRNDGQRAGRLQCMLRAVMFWLPLLVCWGGSLWLDLTYWANWDDVAFRLNRRWLLTASWVLWWAALVVLVGYFLMAIWRPQRSLHDRLAGTWLMPR